MPERCGIALGALGKTSRGAAEVGFSSRSQITGPEERLRRFLPSWGKPAFCF